MKLKVSAKCTAIEKGEDADVVEFHSQKSDPPDVPGSYQVDAILKLTLDKPETRGQFEVGKEYSLDITITPPPEAVKVETVLTEGGIKQNVEPLSPEGQPS